MQNIPQSYLETTKNMFVESNYDEADMRTALELLKLSKFAPHVMALLNQTCNLTEGFMPVEESKGKIVEKMKAITT